MNRAGCASKKLFYSFTLVLIASIVASGQQKPTAIWADVDLSKAEPAKVTKAVKPPAIDPKREKSIWHEPAWYVALGGSALDIAGSIATIDGRHAREGNPLFRRADGKLALTRALPITAFSLFAQYRSYKNPKYRKLALVTMIASGVLHGVFGGARGFAKR